jgi:hypothetical protein
MPPSPCWLIKINTPVIAGQDKACRSLYGDGRSAKDIRESRISPNARGGFLFQVRRRDNQAIRSMRARLVAYSKAFPHAKLLREQFQHVSSLAEIDEIASRHGELQGTAV